MSSQNLDPETLALARQQVRRILTRSPAYRQLPPEKRKALAHDMVKVAAYIVDGGGETKDAPLAVQLAGAAPAQPVRRPSSPATAGQQMAGQGGAVAAQAGRDAYTELVAKVDFPSFVSGLLDGVFDAVVDSSIKQMEAYSELVKNVAMSVDEYMKENITENQARDYLVQRYPDHLELDLEGDQPRVKPKEGMDEDNLPDLFQDLGLNLSLDSADSEEIEEKLVPAARRRIAMDRQQLLATMVMMGINRLVVTDGQIKASCLFELDTTDMVSRERTMGGEYTKDTSDTTTREGSGTWDYSSGSEWDWEGDASEGKSSWRYSATGKWLSGRTSTKSTKFKVSTSSTDQSEAKVQMHANLAGKVQLNFKSETFPLERMVDILQVNQVQAKAPGSHRGAMTGGPTPAGPAAPVPPPAGAPA